MPDGAPPELLAETRVKRIGEDGGMVWFRRGMSPQQTGVAMVGAKAGAQVLFVGAEAPDLAAQVALVTGLNGRTMVIARGARERIERAAANAGALVDIDDAPPAMLPVERETFDIVVIAAAGDGSSGAQTLGDAAREAFRVVRPGGRIIIRVPARRGGVFGAGAGMGVDPLDALLRAGTVGSRLLATAEGIAYYEGRRPRS